MAWKTKKFKVNHLNRSGLKVRGRESAIDAYRPSGKIECAGKEAMSFMFDLAKSTDLSYTAMAEKMKEKFGLNLTRQDVYRFFKRNLETFRTIALEDTSLSSVRALLVLDYNSSLVKDIKILDSELDRLVSVDGRFLELDKKIKLITDIIDKKGILLLRHSQLSGELKDTRGGHNVQVNVFQKVEEERSEIIERMKRVQFDRNIPSSSSSSGTIDINIKSSTPVTDTVEKNKS